MIAGWNNGRLAKPVTFGSKEGMIVQACLNGARPAAYHPALSLTAAATAADAVACVAAGAAELHLHPREPDGRESLARAAERRFSIRVGLEDGCLLPDGAVSPGNAALVAAAVGLFAGSRHP